MRKELKRKSGGVSASHAIVPAASADQLLSGLSTLLEQARRAAVRAANKILAPTYWEVAGGSWDMNRKALPAPSMAKP